MIDSPLAGMLANLPGPDTVSRAAVADRGGDVHDTVLVEADHRRQDRPEVVDVGVIEKIFSASSEY